MFNFVTSLWSNAMTPEQFVRALDSCTPFKGEEVVVQGDVLFKDKVFKGPLPSHLNVKGHLQFTCCTGLGAVKEIAASKDIKFFKCSDLTSLEQVKAKNLFLEKCPELVALNEITVEEDVSLVELRKLSSVQAMTSNGCACVSKCPSWTLEERRKFEQSCKIKILNA